MHHEIEDGYIIYRKGHGPVWVAIHSGPAMRTSGRDDNSDTIANLCWESTAGTLIFSSTPRDMLYGMDLNRELPEMDIAIENYRKFLNGNYSKEKEKYSKKFAFVASSKKTYMEKTRIYKSFWSVVRNSGDFIIFIHRQFARLKNYPSAIDLITFNDMGIKRDILKKIVDETNKENEDFFRKIEKNFKNVTYVEQIKKVNLFGIKNRYVLNDMSILKQYCDAKIFEALHTEYNEHNFLSACSNALKNMPPPEITLEKVFNSESAIGPKKEIIKNSNKIAIEVEINCFLSEWYPKQTASIILSIIDRIKKVEEYKKMGFSQPKILKFVS